MKAFRFTILCIIMMIASSIVAQDQYVYYTSNGFELNYNVNKPDDKWKLPKNLREISGLSYLDNNHLACNQDEKGNIYVFELQTSEIINKIDFGKSGDYEGIEIIGDVAWLLKSNGTLFRVKRFLSKDPKVKEFNTQLKNKNDAEGLGYDPFTGNLLIACKGHPFLEEKPGKEFKAIYSFDIGTKKLNIVPEFLITMDSIKYYKDFNTMAHLGMELLAYFDDAKGDLSFQPSGIAVHPKTGNIYIIGSVGNLLLIFSRNGEILSMIDLRSKYHPQPEGICFSPDGTLYISNEGDDERGTILMFKPTNQYLNND